MTTVRDDLASGLAEPPHRTLLYPGLPTTASRLHVVLLVPRHSPRWLADLVELARVGHSVTVSVVSIEGDVPVRLAPRLPLDMRAFLALERSRHRHLAGRLSLVDLGVTPRASVHASDDADAVAATVAALRPDLVLSDAPPGWQSPLTRVARCGCWQLDANLLDPHYAGLSLLQPVLAGVNVSAIELMLADEGGVELMLGSSVGTTHAGSFRLQRDSAFAKLPALLLRSLRKLANGLLQLPATSSPRIQLPAVEFHPGSGVRAALTALRRTALWQIQKRRPEDLWLLVLRHGQQALDPAAPRIDDCSLLLAPRDDYWADPCVVAHGDRRLIFAEEYPARTHRAVIVCLELRPDGSAERLGIALDQTCHLSYPQVFQWQGQWYLTVESAAARCVRLYRACDFPLRWQPVADLVSDRVCVDPTLYHRDGCWFLFVNISESGGSTSEELFLFVSEQLTGPFRPHPANPIVSDVRRARPAGRLFEHQGRLIRPAQDCAASYGSAIVFSEVLELSAERYRERPLARLDGSWSSNLDGCHTYSALPTLEVLDARGKVPSRYRRIPVMHAAIEVRSEQRELPLVSVLMIVEGDARWLGAAIENVMAQTFADHEILIASNDPSATLLQVHTYVAERPSRVRVIHALSHEFAPMRDALLSHARGRYVAWYVSGYRWVASHLSTCLERLERDPGLGMVHAQVLAPEPAGALFGRPLARMHIAPGVADAYAALLLWQSHPVTGSVVMRRSTARTVGAFDGRFPCAAHSERDYWLRIAAMADIIALADGHLLPIGERVRGECDEATIWQSRRMLIDKHRLTTRGRALGRRALAAMEVDRAEGRVDHVAPWVRLTAFGRALRLDPMQGRVWQGLLRWALHMPRADNGASP